MEKTPTEESLGSIPIRTELSVPIAAPRVILVSTTSNVYTHQTNVAIELSLTQLFLTLIGV